MSTMTPKFISFEGTEGVGKTTAINYFCETLAQKSIPHIRTREPGGSALAEQLRNILLNKHTSIDDATELLLMFSARSDHLHQTILPALERGCWVVCDRFIDSTMAYQGFGRYHGKTKSLDKINLLINHFVSKLPDMTFWLDLDITLGMERAGKRGTADRFETQELAFFERTYQGFCHQYQQNPQRIRRINAHASPQAIIDEIWQYINLANQ